MSFSDMMSSSRGPGVIGMMMALIVLLGFGLLFMFASDEGLQGGAQSIDSVIGHQARDITNKQQNIATGRKALEKIPTMVANQNELNQLKHKNESLRMNIIQLVSSVAGGKADVVRNNEVFEAYKDEYRNYIRNKAKGESIGKLETLTGTVYCGVNIREVTAIGIQIRHDGGQTRIAFEELPKEMKDRFQFDPKQKEKALTQETEIRDHHEAAVAAAENIANQQMDQRREVDASNAREKRKRDIVMKEDLIKTLEDEIARLNGDLNRAVAAAATARAAGRMHVSRSNSISGTIRLKESQISTLRSEVYQLKAIL